MITLGIREESTNHEALMPVGSRRNSAPFRLLLATTEALRYLGKADDRVAEDLRQIARQIKAGQIVLTPGLLPGLYLVFACDHIFCLSIAPGDDTVVIDAIIAAPEGDMP